MTPDVDVVVVAYGQDHVDTGLSTVLASEGLTTHIWLVDNGNTTGAVQRLEGTTGITVLRPGRNLGFAGGVNHGASYGRAETLVVLNSDTRVAPDALRRLVDVAAEPEVGIAAASVRRAGHPDLVNSAGNPLHMSGLSWAGAHNQPAVEHVLRRAAPMASGAAFAIRRRRWMELGGFWAAYFTYHEDTDLSVRVWQRGWRVDYVPDAVVEHDYEFGRNQFKLARVERNRLLLLATLFERRTVLLLAPVLVSAEIAICVWALIGGWFGHKVLGWRWLWVHRRAIAGRRARVQGERRCSDRELSWLISSRLDVAVVALPDALLAVANPLLSAYWAFVRTRL